MSELYPLRFKEILRAYPFGNRWIVRTFHKEGLPADHPISETWEVCDRPGESSLILNGPLKGLSLAEVSRQFKEELLGNEIVRRCRLRFPLLVKFLDASHELGEQAHQDDGLAKRRNLPDTGKTEAWYMIRTTPDATAEIGNKDGVTGKDVVAAVLAGTAASLMNTRPISEKDAFLLYAGVMHHTYGGALFYEIMQNSDVVIDLRKADGTMTDTEARKRAEEAAEGVYLEEGADYRIEPVVISDGEHRHAYLLACEYFALERIDIHTPYRLTRDGDRFHILTQIAGASEIAANGAAVALPLGTSCLLPAAVGDAVITPKEDASVLIAYVPDLLKNVIHPLRNAGVPDRTIEKLGGTTRLNHLSRYL
ncbi:MAG: hypothetical protein JXR37_13495 [Kiritimatiellae bacterium]|nr:hypothetical protein [Kiritimatiellia bacterium]